MIELITDVQRRKFVLANYIFPHSQIYPYFGTWKRTTARLLLNVDTFRLRIFRGPNQLLMPIVLDLWECLDRYFVNVKRLFRQLRFHISYWQLVEALCY
jgi:hypothetical protein